MNANAGPTAMLKHVEHCMGTVFSFHVPGGDRRSIQPALDWLHWVDATFSPYRADSAISRLGRGEVVLEDCPPEVGQVLRRCAELAAETEGYFCSCPDGRLDPSGLVKGWAIEHASDLLAAAGGPGHMINGGGDIQCQGDRDGQPWRVGIVDPRDPRALIGTAVGERIAVATSGSAERGQHIIDPHTRRPARGLLSVTLVGRDLGTVDAYATAAFAMGGRARRWLSRLSGISALGVPTAGPVWVVRGASLQRTGEGARSPADIW